MLWTPFRNDDAAYDDWLLLGMALHSTQAPWARECWDAWSQQSGKYDEDKQEKAWNSFSATGEVTMGTLFHMAQAQGWQPLQDAQQRQNGLTPPAPEKDPPLPYSDYTNALALVRDHGPTLRYCYPWKAWLVWTGTHWQRDTSGEVMRLAKQTVKRLARQVEALDEKHQIAALMAHIKTSLSTAKLKAMVENAQSEPGIAVQPAALDRNPWVLNCANGTLDLRTGTLQPHTREDLLTTCLTIAYDPDATAPLWHDFLWRILGGPWSSKAAQAAAWVALLRGDIGVEMSAERRSERQSTSSGCPCTAPARLSPVRYRLCPYGGDPRARFTHSLGQWA